MVGWVALNWSRRGFFPLLGTAWCGKRLATWGSPQLHVAGTSVGEQCMVRAALLNARAVFDPSGNEHQCWVALLHQLEEARCEILVVTEPHVPLGGSLAGSPGLQCVSRFPETHRGRGRDVCI